MGFFQEMEGRKSTGEIVGMIRLTHEVVSEKLKLKPIWFFLAIF